jgi:hypothetical protein
MRRSGVGASGVVDGHSASHRVVRPATLTIPLGPQRWHLVHVDVVRADRHLRLVGISVRR